jgi:ribosome-associated translation inhibitor RaiA
MKFIIRNQAGVPNKYLRFAKWKIRKLSEKYKRLIYTEIYVKRLSKNREQYEIIIKLGVPGPDIIVSTKSSSLNQAWSELSSKMKRQLRKHGRNKQSHSVIY